MGRLGQKPPLVFAVGAGKGGVGKSTVALGLARALRSYGRVGVLDLDFYGPNIPAMLGIEHQRWTVSWTLAARAPRQRLEAVIREDLAVVSTGFIIGEGQPLGVDPTTAQMMAKQLIHDVSWPPLNYMVVDLPPGTNVVQQILVREVNCAGAIVVVTPQLITLWAKRRGRLGRVVRAGALSAGVAVGLVASVLVLDPEAAGQWLHQVLVPERPPTVVVGNLAALYPTTFANEVALRSTLSFIAIALVIAAVAHITMVAADSKSSTITLLHPQRLASD